MMKEYEGTCKYCHRQEFVIAEDEQDADRIVEDRCDCVGKMKALELEDIKNLIEGICEANENYNLREVDGTSIAALKSIAEAMQGGGIRAMKVDLPDSSIVMKRGETFTIKRETKVCIETEV